MSGFALRGASRDDFRTAVSWAADAGWNPGADDLDAFYNTDPGGFLMGFRDGRAVSSISVVRYGADFGFLGFYIVAPEYRGHGLGMATWSAGMARLEGRTVGLDGVPDQQENYRKSGFVLTGRNIRMAGVPTALPDPDPGVAITAMSPEDWPAVATLDATCFPAARERFLSAWTLPAPGVQRSSIVARRGDDLVGFATKRRCRTGYKIGPLFAIDAGAAESLFAALVRETPDAQIALDVPESNLGAVAMAEAAGLAPAFETARMYRGPAPDLAMTHIWGVTTFELG